MESIIQLRRRAIRNHPGNRHNQRGWIKSVLFLRSHTPSKWHLDAQVIKRVVG